MPLMRINDFPDSNDFGIDFTSDAVVTSIFEMVKMFFTGII